MYNTPILSIGTASVHIDKDGQTISICEGKREALRVHNKIPQAQLTEFACHCLYVWKESRLYQPKKYNG